MSYLPPRMTSNSAIKAKNSSSGNSTETMNNTPEIEFPVVAHHRLIVNAASKNEAETAALFEGFKLTEPVKEVNASSSGKYISFSLSVKLDSKEEMAALDSAIARVPGLKMCL